MRVGVPDAQRALDDDLAAGRLDAATYRRRRDELRAADARSAEPDPTPATTGPPPARDPFPPPFRWHEGPDAADAADVTERHESRLVEGADTTQVVGRREGAAELVGEPAGEPVGEGAADPTQVVAWVPPEVTQRVGTGVEQTQLVPGVALARTTRTAPSATAPPWAAGELQRRQGSELFVRPGGPTPAVLVSTTLVVILAALVVVLSVVLS